MNIFFTYLIEDLNGIPLYVGKGKGSRPYNHFSRSCSYISRKLRKIGGIKFVNIIKIAENISEKEAFALEIKYIALHGRKNNNTGILYNLTDGGEGGRGRVVSEETRQKMRLIRLGTKREISTRLKLSNSAKSRFAKMSKDEILKSMQPLMLASKTPEALAKCSASLKITLARPEVKAKRSAANSLGNNPRARCCMINGQRFTSITEAAIALNTCRANIRSDPNFTYL